MGEAAKIALIFSQPAYQANRHTGKQAYGHTGIPANILSSCTLKPLLALDLRLAVHLRLVVRADHHDGDLQVALHPNIALLVVHEGNPLPEEFVVRVALVDLSYDVM